MISVDRVSKSYGSGETAVRALDDVSLTVGRGEIFGVVGQSGAGKSTLIRTINSLERPDSGSVTVDGRDVTPSRRRFGGHPQRPHQRIPRPQAAGVEGTH
ncbi:ATP-binding cassette domain-containing protein [Arthrobacter oryzae]|uniref:ATP-binding cassette domain-containing protein n=1 Tax=Arthrobacter oryzae TaxID=409290 RepID=UPI0027D8DDE1|nr:ATP-binding cassette domain-containing protein [Arthrobacter oryzae]